VSGTVTIDDGYSTPVKRDLGKVIVIGVDADMPREILAMSEANRLLSVLPAEEAARVVVWLYARFHP
jgi:hypothetical protein